MATMKDKLKNVLNKFNKAGQIDKSKVENIIAINQKAKEVKKT